MANIYIANDRKKVRLIDANWILGEIEHDLGCYEIEKIKQEDGLYVELRDVVKMVCAAPTVDAVEVVHGRWVKCKEWDYDYKCSVCEGYAGEDVDGDHYKLTPYCPNCGAKMDGDGDG